MLCAKVWQTEHASAGHMEISGKEILRDSAFIGGLLIGYLNFADQHCWCRHIARLGKRSFVVLKSRAGIVNREGVCVSGNA